MSKKQEEQSARGTGKTYRACLKALFQASDGLKVVLVTKYPENIMRFMEQLVPLPSFLNRSTREVRFPSGGCVYIWGVKDLERKGIGIKAEIIHD